MVDAPSSPFVMSVKADRYARECGATSREEYDARVLEYQRMQYKGRDPYMLKKLAEHGWDIR